MTEQPQKYRILRDDEETLDDTYSPPSSTWSVTALLGYLGNRLKAVTGRSTWRDDPPTNLTEAKAHHDHRQNPHNVTRAQLGAAAQTALDSHAAARDNPHGVTAAQAGARPVSYVPSWGEITSKPVTYPSTWNTVADKPATYPPSTHTHDYAPASHVGSGGTAHANATTSVSGFMSGADKTSVAAAAAHVTAQGQRAVVNRNTVQSIASGTPTKPILFEAESVDVGDFYDISVDAGRFVIAESGLYLVVLVTFFRNLTRTTPRYSFRVVRSNSAGTQQQIAQNEGNGGVAGGYPGSPTPVLLSADVGDRITFDAFQDSGVAQDISPNTQASIMRLA